jgi:hypothetical protein
MRHLARPAGAVRRVALGAQLQLPYAAIRATGSASANRIANGYAQNDLMIYYNKASQQFGGLAAAAGTIACWEGRGGGVGSSMLCF